MVDLVTLLHVTLLDESNRCAAQRAFSEPISAIRAQSHMPAGLKASIDSSIVTHNALVTLGGHESWGAHNCTVGQGLFWPKCPLAIGNTSRYADGPFSTKTGIQGSTDKLAAILHCMTQISIIETVITVQGSPLVGLGESDPVSTGTKPPGDDILPNFINPFTKDEHSIWSEKVKVTHIEAAFDTSCIEFSIVASPLASRKLNYFP